VLGDKFGPPVGALSELGVLPYPSAKSEASAAAWGIIWHLGSGTAGTFTRALSPPPASALRNFAGVLDFATSAARLCRRAVDPPPRCLVWW
jgi:hypothetical protein